MFWELEENPMWWALLQTSPKPMRIWSAAPEKEHAENRGKSRISRAWKKSLSTKLIRITRKLVHALDHQQDADRKGFVEKKDSDGAYLDLA